MFDNNWNILIVVFVLVLIFAYLCNNNEEFAGTLEAKNAEAIANVASLYNKDNLTVTNLNVTGNAKFAKSSNENSEGIEFMHTNGTQGIGLGYNTVYATGTSADVPLKLQAKGTQSIILKGNVDVDGNINLPRGKSLNYASNDPTNFYLKHSAPIDGLSIGSWLGGELKTFSGGEKKPLFWNNGGVGINGVLCVGGTCINETEFANLKMAASRMYKQNNRDVFNLQGMVIPNINCHGNKNKSVDNLGCWLFGGPDGPHVPL